MSTQIEAGRQLAANQFIIEDMEEAIESHKRCQYCWLTSSCIKFLFVALLASALLRDS